MSTGLQQLKQTESELIAALFNEGLKLHQMGRLADAENIYSQILAVRPDHFDCLHLIGVIFHQRGNHVEAVRRIDLALKCNPSHAPALNYRGIALTAQGAIEEALLDFSRAAALAPDFAEAHCNRGKALRQLGRSEEALASCDRAVKLHPNYAEAYSVRGLVLFSLYRFEEALASCNRALEIAPDYAEAYCHQGLALKGLERFEEALQSCDRALALRPGLVEALCNRSNVLRELDRFEEALASSEVALAIRGDFVEAQCASGNALLSLKHYGEALKRFDLVLAARPGLHEAHCNRGNALLHLKRHTEALQSYDRAVALKPDLPEAILNRGKVLRELGRFEEAIADCDRAITIKPDYADAYCERGLAVSSLGRIEEALEWYRRALELEPDCAEVHLNEAMGHLLLGHWERGWEKSEWRWETERFEHVKRPFTQPLWLGTDDIAGKTILLHAEQGLGDTIQFVRYAPLVAERGARVILEVQRPLTRLVETLSGVTQIVAKGDRLPDFDLHCPLLSLPKAFHTKLETIPNAIPYLSAAAVKVQAWEERLGKHSKPRIGLVWAGTKNYLIDRDRSLAFEQLVPLLDVAGCDFFSLQKGDEAVRQLRDSAWCDRVVDFTDEIDDFYDTAALVENLDLVVSVDTSVLHLAGALGKPVWLMNRYNTCWRWLRDRDDSPWYPSLRLFRQDATRDWHPVISRIAAALRSNLHAPRSAAAIAGRSP
jgi:tetratricopeptide (TPR) repeat protein